ncbi:uncharacterized protein LOC117973465 [Acipenser ruthenus]|uniref:uncharacterized protein LOC117973465 n=1 Tax=Acipenser ruthenus TaxID=7906 RepID=UPI00274214CA|nr:uncharacterized protein LOC117973465 [Acipenser ruthenus]
MMTLLGMAGYCRAWIPDYAAVTQPLADLIHGHKMTMKDTIDWTPDGLTALKKLKQLLSSPPCLGLLDHSKPFNLFVCEKGGFMLAVLTQEHGGKQRPVAFYSKRLDNVARGLVCCLRAVAAATEAVLASADLVAMCPLTVHVPHAVHALISQAKTAHLTPARLLHYQNVLMTMSHVVLKRCTVLNPATLLPTEADGEPHDGEPHDCTTLVEQVCKPRPNLTDVPLLNAAVCKCQAHTNASDPVSQGNAVADAAAKAAAASTQAPVLQMVSLPALTESVFSLQDVADLQHSVGPAEIALWKNKCSYDSTHKIWVKAALPEPKEGALHKLLPGDWVIIKDLRRKHWHQQRWTGPFQVLLTTQTAVKVAERSTWVHASHCRKVPYSPKGDVSPPGTT